MPKTANAFGQDFIIEKQLFVQEILLPVLFQKTMLRKNGNIGELSSSEGMLNNSSIDITE